ncbi:MAG: 50S ribosomal protein L6 [Holosporales bacterium]|jgi:large subunit ribosomal protein L6|nr:50S ribosomal protein L6 [Holosporales bacterium]
MSRVGKHAIIVPTSINVICNDNTLKIKKGVLEESYNVPKCLKVEVSDGGIKLIPQNDEQATNALWGTSQRNISNIVNGLDKGFKIDLELVGVGYKAAVQGKNLVLQLGYSHDVVYEIPEGISITCSKPTSITVSGHCKKQVGSVAARIRQYRKPEPYKGKGIMRAGEFIYRKEGKKK